MTTDYWFACLGPEDVDAYWDRIGPLLGRAVAEADGEIDMLDVHDGIQTGRYRIAVMGKHHEIVLATALEVICYARKAVLNVTLLAGRDARIFFSRFFHHIKDYARDIGCVQVQAGCGRAQTRLFNRLAGSHSVYSVIRLDV